MAGVAGGIRANSAFYVLQSTRATHLPRLSAPTLTSNEAKPDDRERADASVGRVLSA